MRKALRNGLVLAGVTLLFAGGCSDGDSGSTTAATVASSTSTPAATTTVAVSATTSPPTTTAPAGPAVAEAGGWRLVITAPTAGARIGSAFDLCYTLTGPAQGAIAFDIVLISAATGNPNSSARVDGAVGKGSARVNIGTPEPRFYDMTVQALLNGQPIDKLVVRYFINFATGSPAGCA